MQISITGELKYEDTVIDIGDGGVGPLDNRLFEAIKDIQYGKAGDPAGWIEAVG